MPTGIIVPRLNTNEDQVLLTCVLVRNGDRVKKDDLLFVLETTKATFDVLAQDDGTIDDLDVVEGQMVDVGRRMCTLNDAARPAAAAGLPAEALANATAIKTTAKARIRAQELGVNLARVPASNGVIGVKEVEAYKSRQPAPATVPHLEASVSTPAWASGARARMTRLPGGRTRLTSALAKELGVDLAIDSSVVIEAEYLFVGADVRIGTGTRIQADRLFLGDAVTVGADCTLITPELILGDGTLLAERVSVDLSGGRTTDSRLLVGPICLIGSWVHINTCREVILDTESAISPGSMIFTHSFWQSVLDGYAASFEPVRIESRAWVGAGCQVSPGVRVGSGAVVMSNSTVISDVPPETLVGGVPAKVLRQKIRRTLDAQTKRSTLLRILSRFAEHLRARECQVSQAGEAAFQITLPDGSRQGLRLVDGGEEVSPAQDEILLLLSGRAASSERATVFDLTHGTVSGPENRLAFETRNFLRRFGLRFKPYRWRVDYRKGL
jgi:acetyltransferase-like isoleucine patch superfamily enzyme